jgi:hypothetical protein
MVVVIGHRSVIVNSSTSINQQRKKMMSKF